MTTRTSLYLSLDAARDLAGSMTTRYFDARDFLDGAKDAQSPEYHAAMASFGTFLDGAIYAFKGRTRGMVESDVLYAWHKNGDRPKRGEGRTEWMGRMIDTLTSLWGVPNGTHN